MRAHRLMAAALLIAGVASFLAWSWPPLARFNPLLAREAERYSGYYSLVDERGRTVVKTGLAVTRGDRFIDPANTMYLVERVKGDMAYVRTVEAVSGAYGISWASAAADYAIPFGREKRLVVVYHTHSDESYIPSDGKANIPGNGGIYDVGEAFSNTLRDIGFKVIHDRTRHDPHDALAYTRSRRTVLKNLKFGPLLLFDLHRDSAPAGSYAAKLGEEPLQQVMIVVGRQNLNMKANLALALKLKSAADERFPDLVRGIFLAKGNYNQGLDPGALLLEMGTAPGSKEAAVRGATLMAKMVGFAFGAPGK